jgi:hypothetical protein
VLKPQPTTLPSDLSASEKFSPAAILIALTGGAA